MQIQITTRQHLILEWLVWKRRASERKSDYILVMLRRKGMFLYAVGDMKESRCLKAAWRCLKPGNKIDMWSSAPTSEYLTKGNKISISRYSYTLMFIAAIFTGGGIWNNTWCSRSDEWKRRMCHSQLRLHSHKGTKFWRLPQHGSDWIAQVQKDNYYIVSLCKLICWHQGRAKKWTPGSRKGVVTGDRERMASGCRWTCLVHTFPCSMA